MRWNPWKQSERGLSNMRKSENASEHPPIVQDPDDDQDQRHQKTRSRPSLTIRERRELTRRIAVAAAEGRPRMLGGLGK